MCDIHFDGLGLLLLQHKAGYLRARGLPQAPTETASPQKLTALQVPSCRVSKNQPSPPNPAARRPPEELVPFPLAARNSCLATHRTGYFPLSGRIYLNPGSAPISRPSLGHVSYSLCSSVFSPVRNRNTETRILAWILCVWGGGLRQWNE